MEPVDREQAVVAAERATMDGLSGVVGRRDPHAVLRDAPIPGTSYAFVRAVLHDRRFVAPTVPESTDLMIQLLARFMPRLPPDRHAVVRQRFSGLFTARRVGGYRDIVRARCSALIDAMDATGAGDLVQCFAEPLPFTVIADVLGVDADRQEWLRSSMATLGRGFAGQRTRQPVEAGNQAAADMLAYLDDLLNRRAREPRDDLASLLAAEPSTGEERADVLANCLFFILAGHSTTSTMLCAGVDLLLADPVHLQGRRGDPDAWAAAVEEILRYVSPITLTGVKATADAVVAGHHVPAGAQRIVAYAAANRNPAVFANPDKFDPFRAPNPHLAFSAGATFCLGAPLARLHGNIALPMLLDRLPGLRLEGPPTWRGSTPMRQVESMNATW
jgi:pimeloyl-[acyl-carrier protein] synthase